MSEDFKADRIDEERPDPIEGSSVTWLNIPAVLFSLFLGFGVTYLALQTDSTQLGLGDSRTLSSSSDFQAEPSAPRTAEEMLQLGEQLYKQHCQACHQVTGKGLGATFPPLDGSEWVTGQPETLVAVIAHGMTGEIEVSGTTYNGVMPAFKETLSRDELAALSTYVRGAWSNQASPVDPEVVDEVLRRTEDRSSPWEGGQELEEFPWQP